MNVLLWLLFKPVALCLVQADIHLPFLLMRIFFPQWHSSFLEMKLSFRLLTTQETSWAWANYWLKMVQRLLQWILRWQVSPWYPGLQLHKPEDFWQAPFPLQLPSPGQFLSGNQLRLKWLTTQCCFLHLEHRKSQSMLWIYKSMFLCMGVPIF